MFYIYFNVFSLRLYFVFENTFLYFDFYYIQFMNFSLNIVIFINEYWWAYIIHFNRRYHFFFVSLILLHISCCHESKQFVFFLSCYSAAPAFLFLLTFMGGAVIAKYNHQNVSPFIQHNIAMRTSIFAVFIYSIAAIIYETFNSQIMNYLTLLGNIRFLSSYFDVDSTFWLVITCNMGLVFSKGGSNFAQTILSIWYAHESKQRALVALKLLATILRMEDGSSIRHRLELVWLIEGHLFSILKISFLVFW